MIITKDGQQRILPWLLDAPNGDQVLAADLTAAAACGWVEYIEPIPTPAQVAAKLEETRAAAIATIDDAAQRLDARFVTVGGMAVMAYALRKQQVDALEQMIALGQPYSLGNDMITPPERMILGVLYQAPPRKKWGLIWEYYDGLTLTNPTATELDAIYRVAYERDLWLCFLDQREKGRLGSIGKPAVRAATTEAQIIAMRDAAVAFLDSVGSAGQ